MASGRESQGRPVDQGVIARIVAGVRYAITGAGMQDGFFTPGQPLPPQAQDKAEGRQFDYPVGYNLRLQPRDTEQVSFAQLRGLADGYDLLRLVIETRKDQIEAFDWEILPVDKEASAETFKSDIKEVSDFLIYPDVEHNWQQWLRMVVEEMLVVDAVCVYPRESKGGKLYGLELVDGSTIKRLIDATGRTPMAPDPAYQQILKGLPAVDYTTEDLMYLMRNPRVSRIYGFSPVEQVITTVNIALRRQMSQLEHYTSGNIPEALAMAPDTWTPKQVSDFQTWWDAVMEGNLAQRRKMRFIPPIKGIEYPKKEILKDEMDEWLARIVCFAFSISPSALIKQVNRASGEQMADTAKEEGLMPLLRFVETFMTQIVQKRLGKPNLRFTFKTVNRVSGMDQAKIHATYINAEVMTPDEAREELGMDALPEDVRNKTFPMPLAFNQAVLGGEGADADIVPAFQAPGGKPQPGGPNHSAGTGGTGAAKPASGKPPAPEKAETVEVPRELLSDLVRLVEKNGDPETLLKVASALRPNVVEVRPDVQVNVGDNVVNVPQQPAPNVTLEATIQPPASPELERAERVQRLRKMADGSVVISMEEKRNGTA